MLSRELFPQYGRVVIIDDKLEEIKGLIDLLSRQSIPFVYLENVPDEYNELQGLGIRIVFLDLVLTKATDEKTVKSILYGNLTQLIKEDNGPYIIAVWSTQREHYEKQIEDLRAELTYPPEDIIYLDKTPYKEYTEDLKERLEADFEDAFSDCKLFSFLSLWENSINKSAISVASDFNAILPEGLRKANIYAANLARMMLAKKTLSSDISNENRVFAAYEGLNMLLNKASNHNIVGIASKASNFITINSTEKKIKEIKGNTLLWIGDKYAFYAPKNVYISANKLDEGAFPKKVSNKNAYKFLEIDITHKCTYYQNSTASRYQLVYGVLFKNNGFTKNDKNQYWLRIGDIMFEEQEVTLAVYLGTILEKNEQDLSSIEAVFSISDEVYSEIRSGLGSLYSKSGKIEF